MPDAVETVNGDAVESVHAVVVGSGFGGSVTALRLANEKKSVCVLERGRAWPPGSFARRPREMATNFWDPSQGMQGLFDIWSFRNLEAVVASGLGGGSLIYANVLIRKPASWFVNQSGKGRDYESWPVSREELEPHYDTVAAMLEGTPYPYAATTPKSQFMQRSAARLGKTFCFPPLAISFSPAGQPPGIPIPDSAANNLHGASRSTCKLCGECDIGCNEGSKNTLDFNYLSEAERAGADLRTRCEVRSFVPYEGGFKVFYVRHLETNEGAPIDTSRLPLHEIRCRVLVLAAGALGSTFLLLRNRDAFPNLGPALGTRFNGNGDALGWIHGSPDELEPSLGPVITSTWFESDRVDGGGGPGYFLQDGGHPGFIDWIAEAYRPPVGRYLEMKLNRWKQRLTGVPQSEVGARVGALLGGGRHSAGILPLLAFGRDVPDGVLSLRRGYLDLDISDRRSQELIDRIERNMSALAQEANGKLLKSPGSRRHRRMTSHPVGGVPMGSTREHGVVDSFGEVFGHPGLFVVDGSVMPGPVGTNPSMTIAALAERFSKRILDRLEA